MATETESDDPLAGAAVGETRTFEHATTVHMADVVSFDYVGWDRDHDVEITNVDVVEDDREGYYDDVRIEYEVAATKHLPPDWDQCRVPRTDAEEKQARRDDVIARVGKAFGAAVPIVGVAVLSVAITQRMFAASEMIINGEPVTAPSLVELVAFVVAISLVAWVIQWAIIGGFKPRGGFSG